MKVDGDETRCVSAVVPQPGGVQPLPPQPIYGTPEPIPLLVDPEWLDAALMVRPRACARKLCRRHPEKTSTARRIADKFASSMRRPRSSDSRWTIASFVTSK